MSGDSRRISADASGADWRADHRQGAHCTEPVVEHCEEITDLGRAEDVEDGPVRLGAEMRLEDEGGVILGRTQIARSG